MTEGEQAVWAAEFIRYRDKHFFQPVQTAATAAHCRVTELRNLGVEIAEKSKGDFTEIDVMALSMLRRRL